MSEDNIVLSTTTTEYDSNYSRQNNEGRRWEDLPVNMKSKSVYTTVSCQPLGARGRSPEHEILFGLQFGSADSLTKTTQEEVQAL